MSSRKRKHTRRASPNYNIGGEESMPQHPESSSLFVQAHEATIIRDQPDIAGALTAHDHDAGKGGLIQWHADGLEDKDVWVDRYDARLLLTSLPTSDPRFYTTVEGPPSPTGWSDLPSDTEDTFFFDREEIDDLKRQKRRKLMDIGREQRLRAMRESDPDPVRDYEEDRELWGGDNEEPEDDQRMLMERTSKHLLSSPNPGQLEMRILANHGSDQRFAFLRGRWRNAWRSIKLAAKAEKDKLELKQKVVKSDGQSFGGLVAYGDSDDDEDVKEGAAGASHGKEESRKEVDEKEKEARRVRAREWAKRRKEVKADSPEAE